LIKSALLLLGTNSYFVQDGYWRSVCEAEIPRSHLEELAGCESQDWPEISRLGWREVHRAWLSTTFTPGGAESQTVRENLPCLDSVVEMRLSGDFLITGHETGWLSVQYRYNRFSKQRWYKKPRIGVVMDYDFYL